MPPKPKKIFQKLKTGGRGFASWGQEVLQEVLSEYVIGRPRVRCYVDGLNFYHGIAEPYNFKWINIEGLLQELLETKLEQPKIEKIIMFTAVVKGTAAEKQVSYLNMLEEQIDCLDIVWGAHVTREVSGLLLPDREVEARVETAEEKGTDVNLACRMVEDAYEKVGRAFDVACLVTNDGDMAAALRLKRRKSQRVILISPRSSESPVKISRQLKRYVDWNDIIYRIDKQTVRNHPMPKNNHRG